MLSFAFGEEVGSTLSIRGRPLFAYPISPFVTTFAFFEEIFTTLIDFHNTGNFMTF